jgi:hypothetical protein
MASVQKRLEKRWIAEGDELAHSALECIAALRDALADVTQLAAELHPTNRKVKAAQALLRRFT